MKPTGKDRNASKSPICEVQLPSLRFKHHVYSLPSAFPFSYVPSFVRSSVCPSVPRLIRNSVSLASRSEGKKGKRAFVRVYLRGCARYRVLLTAYSRESAVHAQSPDCRSYDIHNFAYGCQYTSGLIALIHIHIRSRLLDYA